MTIIFNSDPNASIYSLQDARDALSEDYEDLEIRLVRIKFLCEVVN